MDLSSLLKPPSAEMYQPSAAETALTTANNPANFLALQLEQMRNDNRRGAYEKQMSQAQQLAQLLAERDLANDRYKTQAGLAGTVHKDVADLTSLLAPLGLNINQGAQGVMDVARVRGVESDNAAKQAGALKNMVDAGMVPDTQQGFGLEDVLTRKSSYNPMNTPELLKAVIGANAKKKDENMVTKEERVGATVLKSKISPEEAEQIRQQGTVRLDDRSKGDTVASQVRTGLGPVDQKIFDAIPPALRSGAKRSIDGKSGLHVIQLRDGTTLRFDKNGQQVK